MSHNVLRRGAKGAMKTVNPRILMIFALLGALGVALVFWKMQGAENTASQNSAGSGPGGQTEFVLRTAPSFELKDSQGKPHSLKDAAGQVTIIHFWATWCPPCLEELPEWVEFAKSFSLKHPQAPVMWMALSRDESWQDALKVFPDQNLPPKMISVLDEGGKISDQYGSYQYPETYILNKKHQIVAKWIGPQQWDAKTEEALLKLSAE